MNDPDALTPPKTQRWKVPAVLVALLLTAGGFALWRDRPPSGWSHWQNHLAERGWTDPEPPHFLVGGFAFDWNLDGRPYDGEVTVAYLVKMTDPKRLRDRGPSWLEERNGVVFVGGRRVRPQRGETQLFLDSGDGRPQLVVLSDLADRAAFREASPHFTSFEKSVAFWNGVVAARHLPRAEEAASGVW